MGRAMGVPLHGDLAVTCADVSRPGEHDGAEPAQGESQDKNATQRPGVRESRRGTAVSASRRPFRPASSRALNNYDSS